MYHSTDDTDLGLTQLRVFVNTACGSKEELFKVYLILPKAKFLLSSELRKS